METITKNWGDLLAFHLIAVERSFTRASLEAGTSKSHLSKQVKRLEAALRTQLFHRTTRKISLTREGEALFAYTLKIFAASEAAGRQMKSLQGALSGALKISAPPSFGEAIFPKILPTLAKHLPAVDFEFDLTQENREVGEFDFVFRASGIEHPDLIAKSLGQFADVLCAAPEIAAKVTLENIGRQECILHSHDPAWNQWRLKKGSEEILVPAKGKLSVNHYNLMRKLCLQGRGIARLPRYAADLDLKKGRLVTILEKYSLSTHPIYLVYARNEFLSAKHLVAKKILLNWIQQHPHYFS